MPGGGAPPSDAAVGEPMQSDVVVVSPNGQRRHLTTSGGADARRDRRWPG
jgi:hypothetical protein